MQSMAGYLRTCIYIFFSAKEMMAFFFFPVARDSFVQYFSGNAAFLLQRNENEMQG